MRPMYEIAEAMRLLAEKIDANDGELTPDLEAEFDALGGEFKDKADNYCGLIREYEAYAESLACEQERLARLRRSAEKTAARLGDQLMRAYDAAGVEGPVKTRRFSVSVCPSPPSYRWGGDADSIPEYLRRIKVEFDATAARRSDKAGELPPGVVVTRNRHLRIR